MFVSNVSHELRTPMAALSAELDLAVQKERSPEQYQNAIHNALQDSQRVIKLIDGLLNLALASAGTATGVTVYRRKKSKMTDNKEETEEK